jgi:hypothetical protein
MKSRKTNKKVWLSVVVGLAFIILITNPRTAQAQQWTTNGNNISNTNSGNVGIGTTSPALPLHLVRDSDGLLRLEAVGHGTARLDFYTNYSYFAETRNWAMRLDTVVFGDFGIYQSSTRLGDPMALSRFYIKNNGDVGIGTTAPSGNLHVYGNNYSYFSSNVDPAFGGSLANVQGLAIGWNRSGANGETNLIYNTSIGSAPRLALGSYNGTVYAEEMTVRGGSVGIGATSPAFKLDVAGVIRSSTGGFKFPDGTVQTTAAGSAITSVTAGAGLTGGGSGGAVTLDIGAGTGLSVASDSVSVNYGSTAGTAVQGNTLITVSAGDGMSGGGPVTLGAGGTLTLTNADKGSSQSIFKNIANAAGTTQFAAGSNNDVLRFEGTGGTSVSFDNATKKVIINSSTSSATSSAPNVSAGQFGQNVGGGDFSFPANVGIGTTTPTAKLHVVGDGKVTGNLTVDGNIAAKYQDVAEWVPASEQVPAGTVVVLDPTISNQVIASTQAYDTRVAGVISAKPGIALGERGDNKVLVATTGRVRIKVDATRSPIHIGDLLVTSDITGMAMKSEPVTIGGVQIHRPGTLIGKALEPLAKGQGAILVLLSLQ